MRIAIIGSGVSGLVCAHLLHGHHDVVLYETDDRPGGHSHTHRVELPDATVDVDTGVPRLQRAHVPTVLPPPRPARCGQPPERHELRGRRPADRARVARHLSLDCVRTTPQHRTAVVPADARGVGRFNRLARGLLEDPPPDEVTLEEVLATQRWSVGFRDWYLVPLGSSIWSAGPRPSHRSLRHLRTLLRTAWSLEPARPAAVADRHRRVALLCGRHRGSASSRGPVAARDAGRQDPTRGRWCRGSGTGRPRVLRPRRGGDPQRPGAGDAVGPRPGRRPDPGFDQVPAEPATLHTDTRLMPRSRRAWQAGTTTVLRPRPTRRP